jgi:hypothetical protein
VDGVREQGDGVRSLIEHNWVRRRHLLWVGQPAQWNPYLLDHPSSSESLEALDRSFYHCSITTTTSPRRIVLLAEYGVLTIIRKPPTPWLQLCENDSRGPSRPRSQSTNGCGR